MADTDLFQPVTLGGDLTLPNRIVMAPLTRSRAGKGDVPGPMNAEYYAQRASAGLIVSEATQISQQGKGHAKGGRIFAQLWHVGRISHPSLQPGGGLPVSASDVLPKGQAFTETGFQPLVRPRALETAEIAGIIADYRHAAECAKQAGFDGVEVHAANGYLLEQFLRSHTNKRTDQYGASIANRVRLVIEAVEAVAGVWGGNRVGIRLSPVSPANDMAGFEDAQPLYEAVVKGLEPFGLAYMHVIEGATQGPRDSSPFDYVALHRLFSGLYMANNGYDLGLAEAARRGLKADLIAFGRPFITNPDLVERLRNGWPLAPSNDKTHWYGGGPEGYTTYRPYQAQAAA